MRTLTRAARLSACCAAALIAIPVLAACGSSDSASSTGSSGGTQGGGAMTVSAGPVAPLIMAYIAQEQGFFEDEGLDVTVKFVPGGANLMTPMVLDGQLDIAVTSAADILPAMMNGAPIKLISHIGTTLPDSLETSGNNIIYKDPSIKRPRDLEGRKVAFNAVGGSHELFTRLAVKADGGDPEKVEFVQLPVQNIPAAIEKGQVDAGQGVEPFLSVARAMGLKQLFPIGDVLAGAPELAYWGKAQFVDDHGDEVSAFARAIARTMDAVTKDPDLLRQALVDHAQFPAKAAKAIRNFGDFSDSIPPGEYERLATTLAENGLIKDPGPIDQWLFNPAMSAEG